MIQFRISFEVENTKASEFEKMVHDTYGPALERQPGFVAWRLLTPYESDDAAAGEEATQLDLEFEFDSEQDRLVWAASSDHAPAWATAVALSRNYRAQGSNVLGASE